MIYSKKCPQCGEKQEYTHRVSFWKAKKYDKICLTCSQRNRVIREGERGRIERSKRMTGLLVGEKNPFYGKRHTKATKNKLRKAGKITCKLRKETRNNFQIWVDKYGMEKAIERNKEFKRKQSIGLSGKNNPMYGKPSPQGSGYGWKGWYKSWFFRSLRELTYLIRVIEKNNWKWKSAETKELTIPYKDWKGNQRTYRADFFVEDKILVECKPLKLHNSPSILLKKEAAEKFCRSKGYIYKIEDVGILTKEEWKNLYNSGELKFMRKYEKIFREKVGV